MKKFALLWAVVVFAAPACFGLVFFQATDNGDCSATITYYCTSETYGPVGIGLDVDVTVGDDVNEVANGHSFFDVFIDYAYEVEAAEGTYTYPNSDQGRSQAALQNAPGLQSLPASELAISQCGLGGTDSQALATSPPGTFENPIVVAILKVKDPDASSGTVSLNSIRGGVVDKNGTMTTNLDNDATITFSISCQPECWNYDCFSCGDANGDCAVNVSGDMMAIVNAWPASGLPYDPCADLNKDGAINISGDVMVIVNHWPAAPKSGYGPGCTDCGPCSGI